MTKTKNENVYNKIYIRTKLKYITNRNKWWIISGNYQVDSEILRYIFILLHMNEKTSKF